MAIEQMISVKWRRARAAKSGDYSARKSEKLIGEITITGGVIYRRRREHFQ